MKKPFPFISALAATSLATVAPHTIQNTFGMTFVEIPAGTFQMGSTATNADAREKPAHRETIAQSFYLGQYEITQGDWQKIMGENPYDRDRSNPYYGLPGMAKTLPAAAPIRLAQNSLTPGACTISTAMPGSG